MNSNRTSAGSQEKPKLDHRGNHRERLKQDLNLPLKAGAVVLGTGLIGVLVMAQYLNMTATTGIALQCLALSFSVVFAALVFLKGHDHSNPGPSFAAQLVRNAVPYTSKKLLIQGIGMSLVLWIFSAAALYPSKDAELRSVEMALARGIENADQATVMPPEQALPWIQNPEFRLKGAGVLWLRVFLGLEVRHPPTHLSDSKIFLPIDESVDSIGRIEKEGLALYPLEASGAYASGLLTRSLQRIHETRTERLLGLSLAAGLQAFSVLIYVLAWYCLLRHKKEQQERRLLFSKAQQIAWDELKSGEIRSAPLWLKFITLQPNLAFVESSSGRPTYLSYQTQPGMERGVVIGSRELDGKPLSFQLGFLKRERSFFVSDALLRLKSATSGPE